MKCIASRNDEYLVDLAIFCTHDLHVPKNITPYPKIHFVSYKYIHLELVHIK